MDFEKIIVELLSRIQVLEEKVDLMERQGKEKKEKEMVTTENIREYIIELKRKAKLDGRKRIILIARDIHKKLNLKSRYPMVCNAMRQCMGDEDIVLFQPPKGYSSTLEIEYKI